jgi:DnaJ-class molecular chaperone
MTAAPSNDNRSLLQALRASLVYEESKQRWPREPCDACLGTGYVPATREDRAHTCLTCWGRGSILVQEVRR